MIGNDLKIGRGRARKKESKIKGEKTEIDEERCNRRKRRKRRWKR